MQDALSCHRNPFLRLRKQPCMSTTALASYSALMTADTDLVPFLFVFKDGERVESMCLSGMESIVLGRHTNCDLIVTHPSVSRHHLEIQVIHGSRELLLTDLDSIHGTWIDSQQALPLVPVTAKEGDPIKLGASSRTYTIRWCSQPPQNSTSSEDHSDNIDSPVDCTLSKEHGAAESRTTMESCKPLQLDSVASQRASDSRTTMESFKSVVSQPAYSKNLKSKSRHKQDESGLENGETAIEYLEYNTGACVSEENCEVLRDTNDGATKVKLVIDSLTNISNEMPRLDDGELQEFDGQQQFALQSSIKKGMVIPQINITCIGTAVDGDGGVNSQKPKHLSKVESIGTRHALSSEQVDEDDIRENLDAKESKELRTQLSSEQSNPYVSNLCFNAGNGGENADVQEAKNLSMLEVEEANPGLSKLWLRRSKLNPPPSLMTSTSICSTASLPLQEKNKSCLLPSAPPMPLTYLINNLIPSAPPLPPPITFGTEECISGQFGGEYAKENHHPSVLCHQERSGDVCASPLIKSAEMAEDYVSDKENDSPAFGHGCKKMNSSKNMVQEEDVSQERSCSAFPEANRMPFQPLTLTVDGCRKLLSPCFKNLSGEENSIIHTKKRPSPVIQNLDFMLRKLKGVARSEPRRAWHIVVDITCFLDSSAFQSLRQLEGIREVRVIIPKIVITELDVRRGIGSPRGKALRWIESCMVKLPSWIHVQSSAENMPIEATPPVSPLSASSIYGGNFDSMMSPTNGDHVLSCALLFNSTVFNGHVALLTNDIALKIKAMSEGLVCESPSSFCESLLTPYSTRFLWANSVAHGNNWTEKPFHSKSMFASAASAHSGDQSAKEAIITTVKSMAFRKNHAVEGLKKQCCNQAHGLRVALAD